LKLARQVAGQATLEPNESVEDVIAGCATIAMRRASLFGRAPVVFDLQLAFTLWGCMGGAPPALVAERVARFRSVSHHYAERLALADLVPESTLRLSPAQVNEQLGSWQTLIDAGSTTDGT